MIRILYTVPYHVSASYCVRPELRHEPAPLAVVSNMLSPTIVVLISEGVQVPAHAI